MKKAFILSLFFDFGCFAFRCISDETNNDQAQPSSTRKPSVVEAREAVRSDSVLQDDLEWLVGRWCCAARQYLVKVDEPLGSHGEDALDYFNVYFPYADERLTLNLEDNPNKRPIAAEFLVRRISSFEPFEEKLAPMSPQGPVRMGTNRIWVGYPFEDFEFRYKVEKRGNFLWLTLESKHMRLELYKLFADVGDIKKSFVHAPIKEYSPERISELKRRYDQLREEDRKKRQATKQEKPEKSEPAKNDRLK